MFSIAVSPAYWWPVKVSVAAGGDDAGKVVTMDFQVEFVRMSEEDFEAFGREVEAKRMPDREIAQRVVRNWREVTGADGASLPFSADSVATACNAVPGTDSAIVRAFFDSRRPAAEKNS